MEEEEEEEEEEEDEDKKKKRSGVEHMLHHASSVTAKHDAMVPTANQQRTKILLSCVNHTLTDCYIHALRAVDRHGHETTNDDTRQTPSHLST